MLELRGISFDVVDKDGTKKSIVKKVDLTVGDGRFVVVTGPNGGGKSTLAKLIAGIETPTAGSILMDGVDVTAKSITERARMG
ncbi:MAG: ATP-binding cassette domain-containing protein, partial [Desulfovibrio sp.]|nr:ATP-binding cassette domain-containing protein [Desulfovibrio sp.]